MRTKGISLLCFHLLKIMKGHFNMHDDDTAFSEFICELGGRGMADFSKLMEESDEIERKAFERKVKKQLRGDNNERD